jgi:hypothetical protein
LRLLRNEDLQHQIDDEAGASKQGEYYEQHPDQRCVGVEVLNMEPALSGLEVIAELELPGGVGPRRRPTPPAGHAPEVGARR